jgi:diphosphomevalonate decarboxylase
VLWDHAYAQSVSSSLVELTDLVMLVSSAAKDVSSSQAHQRVLSSPLWENRVERATCRVRQLQSALAQGHLSEVAQLAWSEMWEMHSLFHTSAEPFTYFEPQTLAILKWVSPFLKDPHPPIVTLDAGPNVHLLVETSRASEWRKRIQHQFPDLTVLQDHQGHGADWIES